MRLAQPAPWSSAGARVPRATRTHTPTQAVEGAGMSDEAADAIFLRWPKLVPAPVPARREWFSFAFWVCRLVVEGIGWLAIVGLLTTRL